MVIIEEFDISKTAEVSAFFVDSFWGARALLTDGQRKQLMKEQERDLIERYVPGNNTKKLPSVFFVARAANKDILGCVGLEVCVCEDKRIGLKYKGTGANNYELRPVLSNLTTSPMARRKGIGQKLVKKCEEKAKAWGYSEVLLIVNKTNLPARRLYGKMGYEDLFSDSNAKTVEITPYQIINAPCTTICMQKNVRKSSFWSFLGL